MYLSKDSYQAMQEQFNEVRTECIKFAITTEIDAKSVTPESLHEFFIKAMNLFSIILDEANEDK